MPSANNSHLSKQQTAPRPGLRWAWWIAAGLLGSNALIYHIGVGSGNAGLWLLWALAGGCAAWGIFRPAILCHSQSGWRCGLRYLIYLGLLLLLALVTFLAVYGRRDTADHHEEAAIVLGAGLRGEQVSGLLALRLDAALAYAAANPQATIVVSGGQGDNEVISEALAMERYLLAHGLAAERILREEQSRNTAENLRLSKQLLDARYADGYQVVVISNDFHLYRATYLAQQLGLTARQVPAAQPWYTQAVNYLRESAAVLRLWLLGY